MKAEDVQITNVLAGPKQFIIPVFQRDYSWGTKQCAQLWADVLRVGADDTAKGHFVGSIVYIAAEESTANIPRWLVIDGQQRLTTVTLLLAVLRDLLPGDAADAGSDADGGIPSRAEIDDYYLRNRHARGDRRHKLHLRRGDQDTLAALLDHKPWPANASDRIRENAEFFREQLATSDLAVAFRGIRKLIAVDVSLVRGQDDPQMIFESLNSTGLDLTQADLIRNFVLMRQDEESQTTLYETYWQPLERAFGKRYRADFDKFTRDYLTLRLRPSRPLRAEEIYHSFRTYWHQSVRTQSVEAILADLHRFGIYYARFYFDQEPDAELGRAHRRLRQVVDVASPVILRLYDCFDREGTLTTADFIRAVALIESYVFRRSVCGMQTRSLGQIFSSLASRVQNAAPLQSLEVALVRQGRNRRFPSDHEFREALETREVYLMRHCHYLLSCLANDSKEPVHTDRLTIEHILPQNPELRPEWCAMLGPDWRDVQQAWVHRLGNLTLTGYNAEYSDRPFHDKQTMPGGFTDSSIRLNKFVREQAQWTAHEIERRGRMLAEQAATIWPTLDVDHAVVRRTELDDRKAAAARYDVSSLGFDPAARALFDALRPELLAVGEDVVELFGPRHVTYRVFEYFVQVLPRKERVFLLLNLDFGEIDDPLRRAIDVSTYTFIVAATEEGGVGIDLRTSADIPAAMHLVRQAYAVVAE